MQGATEIAGAITRQLATLPHGSLAFFGDVFGGRIDNVHVIAGARVEGATCLVVDFEGKEALRVWDPESATISPTAFRIERASRVRWEWFYYGRPAAPENLCVIETAWVAGTLAAVEHGVAPRHRLTPSSARPAVEML